MKFILVLCVALVAVNADDDCKTVKCPKVPKHYEEFGCKPIIEDGECCAAR